MSISVELERVQAEASSRGPGAFLLTVTGAGRPHVVAVTVGWEAGALVADAGRSSVANAGERPDVALLWPPAEPGDYSLIVDGSATTSPNPSGDGGRVRIAVTRAVLHRPATGDVGGASATCTADCVPLLHRA
jgi:hypothetical protein